MTEVFVNPECPFSLKSFDLLAQLKKHSSQNFYSKHEEDFKTCLELPIKQLLHYLTAQLSGEIIRKLNMEFNLFNLEVDFSQPCFEYNFFPKEMKSKIKFNNANFFIQVIQNGFWFGLYVSERSADRQTFIKNVQTNTTLKEILIQNTVVSEKCDLFSKSSQEISPINRLGDWLKIVARQKSATKCIQVTRYFTYYQILTFDYQQLTNEIKQLFEGIFPVFLAATCDEPIAAIKEYLHQINIKNGKYYCWQGVNKYQEGNYQDADEINNYVNEAKLLDISWEEALDEQLLQKILPKLKGADDRVGEALKAFVDIAENKFNLSHAKASKMLKIFEQHGFTSYF